MKSENLKAKGCKSSLKIGRQKLQIEFENRNARVIRRSSTQIKFGSLKLKRIEFGSLKSNGIEFKGRSFESKLLHSWATVSSCILATLSHDCDIEHTCVLR